MDEQLAKRLDAIECRLDELELRMTPKELLAPWPETGCRVCGMPGDVAMGYVCSRADCPSRNHVLKVSR